MYSTAHAELKRESLSTRLFEASSKRPTSASTRADTGVDRTKPQ